MFIGHPYVFLGEGHVQFSCPLKIPFCILKLLSCKSSLDILGTKLVGSMFRKYFLPVCGLSFHFPKCILKSKIFKLWSHPMNGYYLLEFVLFKTHCQVKSPKSFSPVFSWKFCNFSTYADVYDLFWVTFVYGLRQESRFLSFFQMANFLKIHLMKRLSFFSLNCLAFFKKLKIYWPYICESISQFCSLSLSIYLYANTTLILSWLL